MKKSLLKIAPNTDAQTVENIKRKFSEHLRNEFEWSVTEDSSLIAGFTAYIDGTVYDCSAVQKLDSIKRNLLDAIRRSV